jgi:hypothetical protein
LIDNMVGETEQRRDRAERQAGRHEERRIHPFARIETEGALPATLERPPRPKRTSATNLVSGSRTRCPTRAKNHGAKRNDRRYERQTDPESGLKPDLSHRDLVSLGATRGDWAKDRPHDSRRALDAAGVISLERRFWGTPSPWRSR